MWEPRLLTTLWASMACYRVSFTFFTYENKPWPLLIIKDNYLRVGLPSKHTDNRNKSWTKDCKSSRSGINCSDYRSILSVVRVQTEFRNWSHAIKQKEREEAGAVVFKVLSQHTPAGTDENNPVWLRNGTFRLKIKRVATLTVVVLLSQNFS
jgi:hypothetical protein